MLSYDEKLLLEAHQARIKAQQSGKGFTELRSIKELLSDFTLPPVETPQRVPTPEEHGTE